MEIELYHLYDSKGKYLGGTMDQTEAMSRAKEQAKTDGTCCVEQILVTEKESSIKRVSVAADGSFQKLWETRPQ